MSEKKNLMINCDVCDARNAKKEYLSDFEQILINTDLLLVSAESRGILEQLPAICNTDNTLEVDDSVILLFHSGDSVISGGTALQENTVLAVNGNLTIRSDASREVLNSLRAVNVTGSLLCPVSLLSCLKDLYVTGDVKTYPDDCIVMDPIFTPDAYFHLRAKEGQKYYAEREVRFTSPGIDLTALKEKNVRFVSPRFFVPEEKAADALELFDETAFMEAIPDGYAFLGKDTELDEKLLAQYGNRLFIRGNVTLTEESAPLLPGLEKTPIPIYDTSSEKKNLCQCFQDAFCVDYEECHAERFCSSASAYRLQSAGRSLPDLLGETQGRRRETRSCLRSQKRRNEGLRDHRSRRHGRMPGIPQRDEESRAQAHHRM